MCCFAKIYAVRYLCLGFDMLSTILAASGAGINVALHAQVPPSKDMIVGSAITMAGVKAALLRGRESKDGIIGGVSVNQARVFYPFAYEGLHEHRWHLVIIEGWFKMITAFIHEVRAISHPQQVAILFYCLDPSYPGLPRVSALDVDGFLTNSELTQSYLLRAAPTAVVPLAVDTEAFPFHPEPPPSFAAAVKAEQRARIVYVGAAGAMDHKKKLGWMLREAAPYGLDIYGSGWHASSEFKSHWRGVLPEGNLARVYGTSLAVIGVTMDAQRTSGMVNNRVFEALAVGAPLISDHFPALEALFSDLIMYVRNPGDVASHIESLLHAAVVSGAHEVETRARRRRRELIEGGHTWAHRVRDMLNFAQRLPGTRLGAGASATALRARCTGVGSCLGLAIVVDPVLGRDVTFQSTFVPAIAHLRSTYRAEWWTAPASKDYPTEEQRDPRSEERDHAASAAFAQRRRLVLPRDLVKLREYDVIWSVGKWAGLADRAVRAALAVEPFGQQRRGMVLWGDHCLRSDDGVHGRSSSQRQGYDHWLCPDYAGAAGLRWYDVVYCQTAWDHRQLARAAFDRDLSNNLQQAWGLAAELHPGGNHEGTLSADDGIASYETLVVGSEHDIPDMLELLKTPGLGQVAWAMLLNPDSDDPQARPALSSMLAVAGHRIDFSETPLHLARLPRKLSLFVVAENESQDFTPKAVDIFLVQAVLDTAIVAKLAHLAGQTVIAAAGQVGAWAALVAAAGGGQRWGERLFTVEGKNQDGRLTALANQRVDEWDATLYARGLIAGMTRAFCLGRGNSRISLLRPSPGSTSVLGVDDKMTVEVKVDDFDVGRDGQWCITAGARTLLCIIGPSLTADVHVSAPTSSERTLDRTERARAPGGLAGAEDVCCDTAKGTESNFSGGSAKPVRIEVRVELRSNMYRDVLARSAPAYLLVKTTGARAYGIDGCNHDANVSVGHGHGQEPSSTNSEINGTIPLESQTHNPYYAFLHISDYLEGGAAESAGDSSP